MRIALAFLCVVMASPAAGRDRIVSTDASLRQLANVVVQFRSVSGRLPTVEEGLDVLSHKPADRPTQFPWTPFLETTQIPRDGWNKDYVYILDPELAEGFGIYSCGQDGGSSSNGNDRDDLNTWSKDRPWLAYYNSPWKRENLRSTITMLAATALAIAALGALTWRAAKARARSGS